MISAIRKMDEARSATVEVDIHATDEEQYREHAHAERVDDFTEAMHGHTLVELPEVASEFGLSEEEACSDLDATGDDLLHETSGAVAAI